MFLSIIYFLSFWRALYITFNVLVCNYVIVIARAKNTMADTSPRAQPTDSIATSVQQKSTNLNSEFHCYKYLFLLLSSRHFLFYKRKYYHDRTLSPSCKTIFLPPQICSKDRTQTQYWKTIFFRLQRRSNLVTNVR